MHDLRALDSTRSIPGIDHELRFLDNFSVVVIRMIGHDDNAVVLPQIVQIGALHLQIVLAALANHREVRIVIADDCSVFLQQFDDRQRGRFPQIIDVLLVSHAEDKHFSTIDRLLVAIEGAAH